MKYLYITRLVFPCGEFNVSAITADGRILFGFRTRDVFGWKDRARSYTPSAYMPVFQANKPAEMRT